MGLDELLLNEKLEKTTEKLLSMLSGKQERICITALAMSAAQIICAADEINSMLEFFSKNLLECLERHSKYTCSKYINSKFSSNKSKRTKLNNSDNMIEIATLADKITDLGRKGKCVYLYVNTLAHALSMIISTTKDPKETLESFNSQLKMFIGLITAEHAVITG